MASPEGGNTGKAEFKIDEGGIEHFNHLELDPSKHSESLKNKAWVTSDKLQDPDQPIEWTDPKEWAKKDQENVEEIRKAVDENREGGRGPRF